MFKTLVTSLVAATSVAVPYSTAHDVSLIAFAVPLDPTVDIEGSFRAEVSGVFDFPSFSNEDMYAPADVINVDIPKIIAADGIRNGISFGDIGGRKGLLSAPDRVASSPMIGDAAISDWIASALPKFGRGISVMRDALDFAPARWGGIVSNFTSTTCVFGCESPLIPSIDTTAVWLSALQDSVVIAVTSFVTKEIVLPLHNLLDSVSLDFSDGVNLHLDGLDFLGGIELLFTII